MAIRRGHLIGIVFGVIIAALFALLIRAVPSDVFTSQLWLAVIFVASVPAGPAVVVMGRAVARLLGATASATVAGTCAGIGIFDGITVGFAPDVYGQPDPALIAVAAAIIWGVMCNGLAAHLMNDGPERSAH